MKFLLPSAIALILLATPGKTLPLDPVPALSSTSTTSTTTSTTRGVPIFNRPTPAVTTTADRNYSSTNYYESKRLADTQAELKALHEEYSLMEDKLESSLGDVTKLVREKVELTNSLRITRRKLRDMQDQLNAEKLRLGKLQG